MVRSKVDKGISTDLCTGRDRIVLPWLPQYRHVRVALSLSSLAMPPRRLIRLIPLVWYPKPCVLGFAFPAPSEQPVPHIQQCQCRCTLPKIQPHRQLWQGPLAPGKQPLTYHVSGEPLFYVFHEIGLGNWHLGQKERV